jgi:integrase
MPKKTARPEMSWIENRKQWRKRITISGKSRDIYGKTQDEVREKIRELERQADAGMLLGDKTTLEQYAKEWFPVKVAGLKPKSADIYRNALKNHIAPFFKDIRISDIKPLHIQKLMALHPELAKSTQSKILITLSQIMESAVENGLIAKNPCKGVKPGGAEAKVKRPLTKEQQIALAEAVKGNRAECFVLLCMYAGLRREEALGLMWDNVYLDTSAPYIDVRHTVTYDRGRPIHSDSLKTKAAYRSIPIPTVLLDTLQKVRQNAKSCLVIPAVNSNRAMSLVAFRRMWEIAARSVDFHIEPHILRHTYITELCASGMDIKKIQYLAGHADVKMTLKVYAHVKGNAPEELSGAIVKIFSGSISGSADSNNP